MTFDPSGARSPWFRPPVSSARNRLGLLAFVAGEFIGAAGLLVSIGVGPWGGIVAPWGWVALATGCSLAMVGLANTRAWRRWGIERFAQRQPLPRPLSVSGFAVSRLPVEQTVREVASWMTDSGMTVTATSDTLVTGRRTISGSAKFRHILSSPGVDGLEYETDASVLADRVDIAVRPIDRGVIRFIVDDRDAFRYVATLLVDLEQRLDPQPTIEGARA